MLRCLPLAILFLALLAIPAPACPRVVRHAVVVKEIVATPVVAVVPVATFVPVAVAAYGAGYIPPAPAPVAPAPPAKPQDPDEAAAGGAAVKELAALKKCLEALERGGQAPPMPRADAPAPEAAGSAGLKVLQTRCASCHTAGKLNQGTTLELLAADGKSLARLDARGLLGVLRRINRAPGAAGRMPPAPAEGLADDEAAAITELIDSQK